MVDDRVKTLTMKHATLYVLEGLIIERKQSQADVAKMIANALQPTIRPRDQDDPHYDAHPEGENNVKSFQRDPKAPALSLINQDLLYLKKGNSGSEKFTLSEKIVMSYTSFCQLSFLLMILKKELPYDYAETGQLWSLSVFIKSTMIWETIHDFQLGVESYQQKVNLTTLTITFPDIEKYKHGYVTPSLSKEDVEYLQLFEEYIKERLKHRDMMRCLEMYVNGRPLGSRKERLE
ncbi:hypothetical protein Tco_1084154 [Tanacetum coccineum]